MAGVPLNRMGVACVTVKPNCRLAASPAVASVIVCKPNWAALPIESWAVAFSASVIVRLETLMPPVAEAVVLPWRKCVLAPRMATVTTCP